MSDVTNDTPAEKVVEAIEVEIDGKVEKFDKERVVNLRKQQASATQKTQTVAKVLAAAERYGLDADSFAEKSEAALDVIGSLIEQGFLDAQGKPITKESPSSADPPPPNPALPPRNAAAPSEDVKALQAEIGGLKGIVEELRKDSASLIRKDIGEAILKQNPDLDEDDVVKVLNMSYRDKSKGPYEHAKDLAAYKVQLETEREQRFAEKHGIDLGAYNAKQSQDPDGGIGAVIKGKRVVFNPKGPDEISPEQAADAWLEINK